MSAELETARRILTDDTGAAAIEYALLAALIAVAIIAAVIRVGETLDGMYGSVNSELVEHMPVLE
jgi:pilus assembly protein Flp/PilA